MNQQPHQDPAATVMALARYFEVYEEARLAIGRLSPAERAAALRRGLRSDADLRSVVAAAMIVHTQPSLRSAV